MLIRNVIKSKKFQARETTILIISIVIPWIANIIYLLLGSEYSGGVELTPLVLFVTGLVVVFGLMKYKIFEVIPLAREYVFENIRGGIVVFDRNKTVVDFNNIAKKTFGRALAVGDNIEQSLKNADMKVRSLDEIDEEKTFYCHKLDKWMNVQITSVLDENNENLGGILFFL